MRKGEKLYHYLSKKQGDRLFTERNLGIAFDLCQISDDDFNKVIAEEKETVDCWCKCHEFNDPTRVVCGMCGCGHNGHKLPLPPGW